MRHIDVCRHADWDDDWKDHDENDDANSNDDPDSQTGIIMSAVELKLKRNRREAL